MLYEKLNQKIEQARTYTELEGGYYVVEIFFLGNRHYVKNAKLMKDNKYTFLVSEDEASFYNLIHYADISVYVRNGVWKNKEKDIVGWDYVEYCCNRSDDED